MGTLTLQPFPDGGVGAPRLFWRVESKECGTAHTAWQEDLYIACVGGKETYRPDFTYHGLCFMEVTAYR